MRYACLNGRKVNIKDVERGSLAKDSWYNCYDVLACKGHYYEYWRYVSERPDLPEGYENETEWHVIWKSLVYDSYCEVVCGENQEHRADIKTTTHVIEIQKSSISFGAAKERIEFYANLTGHRVIWIVNAYAAWKNIDTKFVGKYLKVKWKYAKRWVVDICGWETTEVYLDISPNANNLLKIWLYKDELFGKWMKKQEFYEKYLEGFSEPTDDFGTMFKGLNIADY